MCIFARSIYTMATFQQLYGELEEKMSGIVARVNDYQHIINNLKKENAQLRQQLQQSESELAEWKNKQQVLSITQSKKEDKAELKKEINQLVREIDYCIGYINSK